MADATIDSEAIELFDMWPGTAWPVETVPTDGFTGSDHHDVVTAAFLVCTKVMVYNHSSVAGLDGWSTFMYAKLEAQDAINVLAARHFCVMHSDATPGDLTNDAGADLAASVSPVAVALSAFTANDYYGWFWVGGVCPEEYVTALGTAEYYTDGTVAIGPFTTADLATPGTAAGEIGLSLVNADTELVVGRAYTTD